LITHNDRFLQIVNDPIRMISLMDQLSADCGFYLCIGSTSTSDGEGVSAAGSTAQARRLTPAADAEALVLGYTKTLDHLPVSPLGIVSPVVITRPCLQLANIDPQVIDCGAFVPPQIPLFTAGHLPAQSVSTGIAMSPDVVAELFARGYQFGNQAADSKRTIVIAECVPGGTTTALAVLLGLGYAAHGSLSSSMPNCNHRIRQELVEQGLARAKIVARQSTPFEVLAAVGDPMQPFVVGMTLAACRNASVVLAGGSQMLAIYALCSALAAQHAIQIEIANIGIITTKWVAFDQHAEISKLSRLIGAPLAASSLEISQSRHPGLQAYDQGHVKEGVGAGAAMALAYLAVGRNSQPLIRKIDQAYDDMVGSHCAAV
jgi:uncharacterized protein (TIGR00303 family)